jgi:hypothetical protein
MLSRAPSSWTVRTEMAGRLMNHTFENIWKETVVACVEYYPSICLEGVMELLQDICPYRGSNLSSSWYVCEALPPRQINPLVMLCDPLPTGKQ